MFLHLICPNVADTERKDERVRAPTREWHGSGSGHGNSGRNVRGHEWGAIRPGATRYRCSVPSLLEKTGAKGWDWGRWDCTRFSAGTITD